jgi:hypothetical protein
MEPALKVQVVQALVQDKVVDVSAARVGSSSSSSSQVGIWDMCRDM